MIPGNPFLLRTWIECICNAAGLPATDVRSIEVLPDRVTVVANARTLEGKLYAADGGIATTTITMPLEWAKWESS